jgi:uncharacterized protein
MGCGVILYLHGFRSSPQSWKARLLGETLAARGLADRFVCPALSHVPDAAIASAEAAIASARGPVTVVGSSLGGFYATWLAERHDLRAVLINPAVVAPHDLERHLGVQENLHDGSRFEFTRAHIAQLQAYEVARPDPARYLLLLEEGDEVLDWRAARQRYNGCRQIILPGGDHSFTRFPDFLPQIIEYAEI